MKRSFVRRRVRSRSLLSACFCLLAVGSRIIKRPPVYELIGAEKGNQRTACFLSFFSLLGGRKWRRFAVRIEPARHDFNGLAYGKRPSLCGSERPSSSDFLLLLSKYVTRLSVLFFSAPKRQQHRRRLKTRVRKDGRVTAGKTKVKTKCTTYTTYIGKAFLDSDSALPFLR